MARVYVSFNDPLQVCTMSTSRGYLGTSGRPVVQLSPTGRIRETFEEEGPKTSAVASFCDIFRG